MHDSTGLEKAPQHQDRRKYARRNQGYMTVVIKRRGFLSELFKGESVDWLNFNQFGFAFASSSRYEVCEEISVSLRTKKVNLGGLVAVIHNARVQAGRYRYGVQFYFGANSYMRSSEIRDLLQRIEDSLD